jgi:hypothetical protein
MPKQINRQKHTHREKSTKNSMNQDLFLIHLQLFRKYSESWLLRTLNNLPDKLFLVQFLFDLSPIENHIICKECSFYYLKLLLELTEYKLIFFTLLYFFFFIFFICIKILLKNNKKKKIKIFIEISFFFIGIDLIEIFFIILNNKKK